MKRNKSLYPDLYAIESPDMLIRWATEANQSVTTAQTVELQDIFARNCTYEDRFVLIQQCKDSRLIYFAIYKIMGHDTFMEFIRMLCKAKAQKIVDDEMEYVSNKEIEVNRKERNFSEAQRTIGKKIRNYANIAKNMREKADRISCAYLELRKEQHVTSQLIYEMEREKRHLMNRISTLEKQLTNVAIECAGVKMDLAAANATIQDYQDN